MKRSQPLGCPDLTRTRGVPRPARASNRPGVSGTQQGSRAHNQAASSTTSTGGWSASSSRTDTTRNVLLRPSGIVSPGLQFGTALVSVGGSAGPPSVVSPPNRKTIPVSSPPEPNGSGRGKCPPTGARPQKSPLFLFPFLFSARYGILE